MTLYSLDNALRTSLESNPDIVTEITLDPANDAQLAAMGFPVERTTDARPSDILELEKVWHLLHFGMTGNTWGGDWPLNFLLTGKEIGEDMGYGPSRLHASAKVAEISNAMSEISFGQSLDAIGAEALFAAEIYPVSKQEPYESWRDFGQQAFEDVKAFLRQAADSHHSLLITLH